MGSTSLSKSLCQVFDRYHAILFDAYGVLVNEEGALPGAIEVIEYVKGNNKPFAILTNGSSRSLRDTAARYQEFKLNIEANEIVSSGSVIPQFIKEKNLAGRKAAVLGTAASFAFVEAGGCEPVSPLETDDYDVVFIANQSPYPLLPTLDEVISCLLQKLARGEQPQIVVANPDMIYPKSSTKVGITAGMIAKIITEGLRAQYNTPDIKLWELGKPNTFIFEQALKRFSSSNVLMVGDQINTDILGAQQAGIDSLLLKTGIFQDKNENVATTPTYTYKSLIQQ